MAVAVLLKRIHKKVSAEKLWMDFSYLSC
jgi:hypothetical protein